MSSKRFPSYQPSTVLRQAIAKYREALKAAGKDPDGRAQLEDNATRDTPGTGAAEGEATRRSDEGKGGAHG